MGSARFREVPRRFRNGFLKDFPCWEGSARFREGSARFREDCGLRVANCEWVLQGCARFREGSAGFREGSARFHKVSARFREDLTLFLYHAFPFFPFSLFLFRPLFFVWFVHSFGRFFKVPQGSLRFVKDLLCLEGSTRFLKVQKPSCQKTLVWGFAGIIYIIPQTGSGANVGVLTCLTYLPGVVQKIAPARRRR